MVSEGEVERVYENALKMIQKSMGDGITSNFQLERTGRQLFGGHFAGAVPPSNLPPPRKHQVLIVNTKDGRGEHWMLRFCGERRGVWYDSFGRDPSALIDTPWIRSHTDRDEEQNLLEMNCGQRCLAAAIVGRVLGVEALTKL